MTPKPTQRNAQVLRGWILRHPHSADLLTAFSGVALVAAFAPFQWRMLSVLCPAVLFLLWLDSTPGRAFQRGYLFGLGYFGLGVSWVFNSIHVFGEAPAVLAAVITAALVFFVALYPAVTGYLVNRYFRGRAVLTLVLGYPAMWTLLEWMRGWFLTGFPWLTLGQAQLDWPLAGVIPMLGATGATWVCAVSAGCLASILIVSKLERWFAAAGIVLLWLGAGMLGRVDWTTSAGASLTASLVQGNVSQDQKMLDSQLRPILERYRRLTRAHWRSDLIIWPETAVPTWYDAVAESFLKPLAREANRHDAALLTGVFVYDPRTGGAYNSVVQLGENHEFYFKRHLVPFGEHLPLRSLLTWIDGLIHIPMSDLSAGRHRPLLSVHPLDDLAVGISICYEIAYGAEINDALPEAKLLVNVSNDAWFGDSLAPHQHLEIARLRALETGRWLLRATNTGISAVIDAQGQVIARSPQFKEHVLTQQVQPRQGTTPFSRWENWAVIALAALSLLAALVSAPKTPDNDRINA